MRMKWTETDDEYIINNYNTMSAYELSKQLGRSKNSISNRIRKLNLKNSSEEKQCKFYNRKRKYTIDPNFFISPTSEQEPISSYLLGYLWADGYISKHTITRKENYIKFCISKDDADDIIPLLNMVGNWCIYNILPKKGNLLAYIQIHNKKLHDFLTANHYQIKSSISPELILQNKSNDYIKNFWRGFMDGDGCYHFNKSTRKRMAIMNGGYDQDWTSAENLLISLGVRYKIHRNINKNGRSSRLTITKTIDVLKFINYIYPTDNYDGVGLLRKFIKAKDIKTYCLSMLEANGHRMK